MALSERETADGLRAGDTAAFAHAFDAHAATVYRYARSMVRDVEAAQDIVQDTFLIAWKKRREVRQEEDLSLLPWLLGICRRVALNELRRRGRRKTDAIDPQRFDAAPAVSLSESDAVEELRVVQAEIAKLQPIDQEICRLCLEDGLTYAQAASLLQLTPAAIGKRLERARTRLRRARNDGMELR